MAESDYLQLGWTIARAAFFVLAGYTVARLAASAVQRLLEKRFSSHRTMVFRRIVYYLVLAIFLVSALNQLGLELSVVLGAAGILSVAVGFASQTSMSNLISGLFLIWENPFSMGDTVKVEDVTGEVVGIDLLSVKLRTPDNLYVRIPNEKLIRSNVTTLTRFPIRRADLKIGIAYKEDIERVRGVLNRVAEVNPICLIDPAPVFIVLGFGESSVDLQFSVWGKRESFLELKNSMHQQIKRAFDEENIEIPFPHRKLVTAITSLSTEGSLPL
ncbi:mechanosensitive ion channel family protein [Motiliproteus sediminis]|uniref:mechanosensitive ion channel family protein n=1 Tax=Motiliproteus sediminis TaxID=1468178 RepID=UPI001AEFB462|nr:mechanosensitive ion channel family protein [Motiliproteus sediminis]